MSNATYTKHEFKSGDTLYASSLNEMDEQIALNEANISTLSGNKLAKDTAYDYYLLKSQNGTVFKVTVTDDGTLKVVDKATSDDVTEDLLEGRLLLWSDEFDVLDTETWAYEIGYARNGEPQYYTSDEKNVYVKDSVLHLVAIKDNPNDGYEWSSGSIFSDGLTKGFAWVNGLVEAKVKVPKIGVGIWPAMWHKGTINGGESGDGLGWAYCGEIDTMDLIGSSYRPGGFWQEINKSRQPFISSAIYPTADEWFIVGVEKTATTLTMYYNREVVATWDISGFYGYPNCAFNLKFNLAMGATSGEIPNDLEQAEFLIDWVRYYAPTNISEAFDISTQNVSLAIGSEYSMNAERQMPIYPVYAEQLKNYFLHWESSDPTVATVSGGYIKTLTDGVCKITASNNDGNAIASIDLNVSYENSVLVEDIDIYTELASLPGGASITLQAYYTPTWATDMSLVCTSDSPYIDCDGATITNNSTIPQDSDVEVNVSSADGNVNKVITIHVLATKSYNISDQAGLLHEYAIDSLSYDGSYMTWADKVGDVNFTLRGGASGDSYQEYTTSGIKSNSNNLRSGYALNIAEEELVGQYTIIGFITDMTLNNALCLNQIMTDGLAPVRFRMYSVDFGESVGQQYATITSVGNTETPVMIFISINTEASTCKVGCMTADGTLYSQEAALPDKYATNTAGWKTGIASALTTQKFSIGTYKHALFYDVVKTDEELEAIGNELIAMYL